MTLLAEASSGEQPRAAANGTGWEFSFPYRAFESTGDSRQLGFTVALTPDAGLGATPPAMADLRAAVAFLVDAAYGEVPTATLARMIGRYFFASGAASSSGTVTVSLKNTGGEQAEEQIDRPGFEVERTAFGTAHILHEDDTLGLYILEIAPHSAIPAHCHWVMRESELILDDGLLQQGQPVARGNAFSWPLGHVHAYRNPTSSPRRILCIDSPRFMPEDEVALAAQQLMPLVPLVNYLA